jgi:hypothetical protein
MHERAPGLRRTLHGGIDDGARASLSFSEQFCRSFGHRATMVTTRSEAPRHRSALPCLGEKRLASIRAPGGVVKPREFRSLFAKLRN